MDIFEKILDLFGSLFLGSVFIELGLSRWSSRKFSWKFWWAILLIAVGVQMIISPKLNANKTGKDRENLTKTSSYQQSLNR